MQHHLAQFESRVEVINSPQDLKAQLNRVCGFDLTKIPGIKEQSAQIIIPAEFTVKVEGVRVEGFLPLAYGLVRQPSGKSRSSPGQECVQHSDDAARYRSLV